MIKVGSRVWDAEGRAWVVTAVTISRRRPVACVLEVEHGCRPPKRLPAGEVFESLHAVMNHVSRG